VSKLTSIEFCAGAGGQAIGLETAGFSHVLLVDNDEHCCETLRLNRPKWNVHCADMNKFDAASYSGVDLFAAGLPCPPFSVAGKGLGKNDERDLFPAALRIIRETNPKFVLIENVKGFLGPAFQIYRNEIKEQLLDLGYQVDWKLYYASDFGVSQKRPRVAIIAARNDYWINFKFPKPDTTSPKHVGKLLRSMMGENNWKGLDNWVKLANDIAPTIVGGSKKHGGPDLGPTRAREAWKKLGVNGSSIAETAPSQEYVGLPRLTTKMVAAIQGFPKNWKFAGKKTPAYRQIGNAFPPAFATALGKEIRAAIEKTAEEQSQASSLAAE